MERLLELLSSDSSRDYALAVKLITPDLLSNSAEQQKHKLKTRISSMLKSSGKTRAYGAVLARRTLEDWSVVKSHGSVWTVILLHALGLPDPVCWEPITKTLTFLFIRVHGKAELAREIAGTKIGDFMKRLVSTLPTTRAIYAVKAMLFLYPTQCRPYLTKLGEWLNEEDPSAIAYLSLSEKSGAEFWSKNSNKHLDVLKKFKENKLEETELARSLQALHHFIIVAADLKVKVPIDSLMSVIYVLLGSFSSPAVHYTCKFIVSTFARLEVAYMQQFDSLVYSLRDCMDMGRSEAVDCLEVVTLLVGSGGWISESYNKVFAKMAKRALDLLSSENSVIGANGLADYVQNPTAFSGNVLNSRQKHVIMSFLTSLILPFPGLPQSVRAQIDRVLLARGTREQIVLATLYPAKYSILPLAIAKIPDLQGMQALVHPRFPPLNTSKHMLEQEQNQYNNEDDPATTAEPVVREEEIEIVEQPEEPEEPEEPEVESKPMPSMPDFSSKVAERPETNMPPEKRAKLETTSMVQPPPEPVEVVAENEDGIAEDEDEELVIPVLHMDSD